jgi:uncharacterized membrane protein YphA (DoxX/SURF4 family)
MGATTPDAGHGESRGLDALRAALGLVFVASGVAKLAGEQGQVRSFERWEYPQWFRVTTGGTETLGGLGLLAGAAFPRLTVPGGGLVAGTMIGAVYTHLLRVDDPVSEAAKPGALLALAALVTGRELHRQRTDGSNGSGVRTGEDGGRADG